MPRLPRTVLVTGANRGLGFGLVQVLARRGDRVIATSRRPRARWPNGVEWYPLDVADDRAVARLGSVLGFRPIDVLINNAGISERVASRSRSGPHFGEVDPATMLRLFDTNAVGPLRVTQALLPNLRRGGRKVVLNLSSDLASVGANTIGRWVAYRASKAALNMVTRCSALALKPEGICCVAVNPGWARTAMGGQEAPMSVAASVAAVLRLMDRLTLAQTGRFLNYDGRSLPW